MIQASPLRDFDSTCRTWQRVFNPIPGREQEAWLRDWGQAVRRITYLNLISANANGTIDRLLNLRSQLKYAGGGLDVVMRDIENIWKGYLADGMKGCYAFQNLEGGFIFHFGALNRDNNYVTGKLEVRQKQPLH